MGKVMYMRKGDKHTDPGSKVPSGYTELVYLKSSGTQYIDSGFTPNQNTRVVCKYQIDTVDSGGTFPFGVRASANSQAFTIAHTTSQLFWNYNNTYEFADYTNINEVMVVDANKNVATFTGSTTTTITLGSGTFTCGGTLTIGALRQGSSVLTDTNGHVGKIWYLQIYDNGTLVRDFVPCINESGEAGMYDAVNGKFYGNVGTGVFNGYIEGEGEILNSYTLTVTGTGKNASSYWNRVVLPDGQQVISAGTYTIEAGQTVVCEVKGYSSNSLVHVTLNGEILMYAYSSSQFTHNLVVNSNVRISLDNYDMHIVTE